MTRGLTGLGLCVLVISPVALAAQVRARASLISADASLSDSTFTSGITTMLAGALGANGVLVWPGAVVLQGASPATRLLSRQPLLRLAKLSWQPFRIEFAPDSSLAAIAGVAVLELPSRDSSGADRRIGRYLAAWSRTSGQWHLAAIAFTSLLSAAETTWNDETGPREVPLLGSAGPAGPFIAADSAFAADAGARGPSLAFAKWAAPDATTFAGTGEINVGPARIGAVFSGNTAHWEWGAVAAGSSTDGKLGWTVGQATITPTGGGEPSKSKYLTLWRRMPDGTIRFTADGGNGRP